MSKCPTCQSPNPAHHPAVQHEGEVHLCRDPWHKPTADEIEAKERHADKVGAWNAQRLNDWREAVKRQFVHDAAVDAIFDLALAGLSARSAGVSIKPVAWMCEDNFGKIMFSWGEKKGADPDNRGPWQWRPLYTEPVAHSASERVCPYCTSDNEAIRTTYYDQTCEGCVKRMGQP